MTEAELAQLKMQIIGNVIAGVIVFVVVQVIFKARHV